MAGYAFVRITYGGEVDLLIPSKQQVQITKGLVHLGGGQIQTERFEELAEACGVEHAPNCRASEGMAQAATHDRSRQLGEQDPLCSTWNINPVTPHQFIDLLMGQC